ncbi:MAG: hypothetical protein ACI96N_002927 [Arenicella sp.]
MLVWLDFKTFYRKRLKNTLNQQDLTCLLCEQNKIVTIRADPMGRVSIALALLVLTVEQPKLSFRDIEELLAARGITVGYETIRNWGQKFGQRYCKLLKKIRGRLGNAWYLDEVFININGVLHYLWRAVDQDGDKINMLVKKRTFYYLYGSKGQFTDIPIFVKFILFKRFLAIQPSLVQ